VPPPALNPAPPLFPYTTLFRSLDIVAQPQHARAVIGLVVLVLPGDRPVDAAPAAGLAPPLCQRHGVAKGRKLRADAAVGVKHERSEEHTSELQSQSNLVCRLLL